LQKRILIKLGGKCNLNCKRCHCDKNLSYEYNHEIIRYINDNYDAVNFSGGEPMLYFDTIKMITEKLDPLIEKRMVTNLTVMSPEQKQWLIDNKFTIIASFDGFKNDRDNCAPKYSYLKDFYRKGFAVTVYHGNMDFKTIYNDIQYMCIIYNIDNILKNPIPNFVHQTIEAPNADTNKEDAQSYILQFCKYLESECYAFYHNLYDNTIAFPFMEHCKNIFSIKSERGIGCCRENKLSLRLDGKFMLCSYSDTSVGDIYDDIDWDKVESNLPDRCNHCELFNRCHNTCIVNTGELECYIYKTIYKHWLKMVKKYNLQWQ